MYWELSDEQGDYRTALRCGLKRHASFDQVRGWQESQVLEGTAGYARAGVTTFAATLFGPEDGRQATWPLLADVARTRPI